MVRLELLHSVTPTMWFVPPPARAVDARATQANKISKELDNEQNRCPDDLRHLERCKTGFDFSDVLAFMITFSISAGWV